MKNFYRYAPVLFWAVGFIVLMLAIIATEEWSIVILSACVGIYLLYLTNGKCNKQYWRSTLLKISGALLIFSACSFWISENLNANDTVISFCYTTVIVMTIVFLLCLCLTLITLPFRKKTNLKKTSNCL